MTPIIVQTTCSNKEEAKNIARALIKKELAACIHMNKVDSFYSWNDEFCEDSEVLLSIKTKKELFGRVKSKIKELHSYDVPEIISFDIKNISKDYKKFIGDNTK